MFSEMGNEYRGSVCGETRWSTTPFGLSPFLTADLDTTWDPHYNSLQDVPDSATGYFMDSNLPINSQDWTQAIIFNSGGGGDCGEKNSQSQILNQELTHDFHVDDSQDPSTFFLNQIHTPANNITYGLFSQQQPIYENPQYHPAAASTKTDDQLSNSPYSPSIFSGQDPPMTMWNTSTDHHFFPSSTPASCLMTTIKSKKKNYNGEQPLISKRPRIETPSPLPTFKVRKEKMGDRITALQQLVSPFGKTDTASVLHEAIDYIKFLHDQVHALSNPYWKNGNPNMIQHQACMQMNEKIMDLKSRGLCLVPISSTFPVASETTADFWTPGAFSR